jgi:glutathione synthase/RimK-type ligase-like ATP-grasp enzyme
MTIDAPSILLVTTAVDEASDCVADALRRRGSTRHYRLNTEDLPLAITTSAENGPGGPHFIWHSKDRTASFDGIHRVWLRRHRLPIVPEEQLSSAYSEYCLRESLWFMKGLLFSLAETVRGDDWMSHPSAVQRAESKILQLTVATRLGLRCPETLVSNDPDVIRSFFQRHRGEVVAKALRMAYFDLGDEQRATYTTQISEDDLADADSLRLAPVIYQRHISKQCDVRVTVVGDKIYAARIESQAVDTARVDWRRADVSLDHEAHQLPPAVSTACLQLMADLHLAFGAIDFVLTPGGDYVFLEVNPGGQWLWLEDKLGFPISDDIAAWLLRQEPA